ncbi:hypothetical protein [Leptospira alexanderi]|uniref:hypothetical protein n=1 Tax=Leptospira alexanderi TaxID=100053 RepID=UPI00031ED443|nr:hypothetical protein [Leptospira alexanderi]
MDIVPGFKKLAENNFQKQLPEIAGSTLITCGLIALGIWYLVFWQRKRSRKSLDRM